MPATSTRSYIVRLMTMPVGILSLVTSLSAQAVDPAPNPPPGRPPQPVPPGAVAKQADAGDDDTVVMSPFEVSTSGNDIGYFASNTLAGSRLNSKIGDLAAPITVITKQQLEDTNSHDLNDVFLYEANTEGSLNYTAIEVNRSGLKDRIGGSATNGIGANTATTANRIRGLSTADTTWNYYSAIPRIRADSYNAESLEISRGPNSILAGLGSPAGILNQTIGTGKINSNTNEANLSIGSYGTYRVSLNLNRTLIKDKLAISLAGLYEDREYARKPSFEISRRQTAGFTYRPFRKTTFKGFVEGYTTESRAPNQIMPRDGVTPWLQAGRPVWNPLTRQVTYLDSGRTTAAYGVNDTLVVPINGANVTLTGNAILTDTRSPRYVPGLGFDNTRATFTINPDGSYLAYQRQATVFNIYGLTQAQVNADPVLFDVFQRRTTSSALPPTPNAWSLAPTNWVAPSVSDKHLYNYDKYNITAANFGRMRNGTYNLEFEQQLLSNLFFSAGWFRQDLDTLENYGIAQQAPTTIQIDTNTHLPDGRVNPNLGRPYVSDVQADTAQTPETTETYRAMLAYDLDFTKHAGWSKWLGRHRFLGFVSHQENVQSFIRQRFAFSDPSDPRFLAPVDALGLQTARVPGFSYAANGSNISRFYYIGGTDGLVSSGPATNYSNPSGPGTRPAEITAYNYSTRTWEQAKVTTGIEWFDAGNGIGRSQKLVNTLSFATQNYFLKDRIITTIGVRKDRWSGRNATTGVDAAGNPALTAADLYPAGTWRLANTDKLPTRWGRREYLKGTTGTTGIVVKPLSWLSLSANRSDNFNPPPTASSDIFGRALPKPTGESKDYGFSLNLMDNKLIARVIFFETTSEAERVGAAANLLGRLVRADTSNFRDWANYVVRIRDGEDPTSSTFNSASVPLTTAQQAKVAELTGLPYNWPQFTTATTQSNQAKGTEIEVIYNPTPNWNIKFTAAKQKTSFSNVMPEYEEWYQQRLAVWKAAVAPDMPALITLSNGRAVSLRNYWSGYGFGETNVIPGAANGTNPETWYQAVVAGEVANTRQLEGAAPFGQRNWRANILSNYRFSRGPLKNLGVGGAVRWEDKGLLGYYGVTNDAGLYTRTDVNRKVYDTDRGVDSLRDLTHFDFWVSYSFKVFSDKVRTKVQLNVRDAFESGGIVPVYVNWDGQVAGYRIVDSRQITLSAKFDF